MKSIAALVAWAAVAGVGGAVAGPGGASPLAALGRLKKKWKQLEGELGGHQRKALIEHRSLLGHVEAFAALSGAGGGGGSDGSKIGELDGAGGLEAGLAGGGGGGGGARADPAQQVPMAAGGVAPAVVPLRIDVVPVGFRGEGQAGIDLSLDDLKPWCARRSTPSDA